jgi:hypothetical protein
VFCAHGIAVDFVFQEETNYVNQIRSFVIGTKHDEGVGAFAIHCVDLTSAIEKKTDDLEKIWTRIPSTYCDHSVRAIITITKVHIELVSF